MTKSLDQMSVDEAVTKAFEVMLRADYADAQKETKYSSAYTGSFEEYVEANWSDLELDLSFDTEQLWRNFKYESSNSPVSYENWEANVEASYGGEGEGSAYWMVISVSDGISKRYFRKDGYYASYDGGYLDGDTYEVSPKEKVITVYTK